MPSQILIRDPTAYPEQPRNTATTKGLGGEDSASASTVFVRPAGSERRNDGAAISLFMNDISASPRLFGYFFCCISSIVSMISSSIFYTSGIERANLDTILDSAETFNVTITPQQKQISNQWIEALHNQGIMYFYETRGNIVQRWKVFGAIAVSGLMALITLLVLVAHFDSYFFPRTFRRFFADGSKSERNLILVLIVIAICALQINTSRFSVGEAQANVFFSAWTSFIACVFNYELWRKNAGRHLTFENVLFDKNFRTKRFWMLLAIFSTITLLAFFEHTLHNNFMEDEEKLMNCMIITGKNEWMWMFLVSCVMAWGFLFFRTRCKLSDIGNPKLVWILETTFSGALVAMKGTAIANFTGGVSDKVPCPSNLYFGLWGAFVVDIWIFSSLLQNHHIYWHAKEEEAETSTDRRGTGE
jgi:hypothetical protein